jgi:hypothetical protein
MVLARTVDSSANVLLLPSKNSVSAENKKEGDQLMNAVG